MRITLLLAATLLIAVNSTAWTAQNWDYVTNPVTVSEPGQTPSWASSAQYAFDGDGGSLRPTMISHCWFRDVFPTPSSPHICIVDYGQPVAITKFVHYFHIPSDKDYRAYDPITGPQQFSSVKIYRSGDSNNWALADAFDGQSPDFPQIFALSQPTAARYYKFEITGLQTNYYGLRTYEIESYTGATIIRAQSTPTRTGTPVALTVTVKGSTSYTGVTVHVAAGSAYTVLANDVAVNSQGIAVVQVLAKQPGNVRVALELRQVGTVIDTAAARLSVDTRIALSGVTLDASGIHGTATNSSSGPLSPAITWQGSSAIMGTVAAGAAAEFDIPGTPSADGLQYAEVQVTEDANAGFIYRKAYTQALASHTGHFSGPEIGVDWNLSGAGLMLGLTPAGSQSAVTSTLSIKLDNVDVPLEVGQAAANSLKMRSVQPFGLLELVIEPDGSGLRITHHIVRELVDTGILPQNTLKLTLTVPDAIFRFLPGWKCTPDVESQTTGADYVATRMAALSQPGGTISLVPNKDRCQIGIVGDTLVQDQLFDGAPIVTRVVATSGDWFNAFKYVVGRIYQFSDPLQYRTLTESVSGQMRYLSEDQSIWNSTFGTICAFPTAEWFFNFYGTPYSIPALYTRYLTTGDNVAHQRAKGIVNWLCNSSIKSNNPATNGAYYSQYMIGLGSSDQGSNYWIQPHSSGASAWALLYYWNVSGRTDTAALSSARAALDWLISIQKPDGGWNYAYFPNGVAVTQEEGSGNIWSIWSLYRMWKYTGEIKYLTAATRGKDWFIATWLPKHMGRGYWEDACAYGNISLSWQVHEFAIATRVFAEMGDSANAVECAKTAITWVWTRTIDSRDYFTSYGHVHEQLSWPPATYLAPIFGVAAQTAYQLSGDPFFAAFSGIPKTIGWWTEPASGSGFWPAEATSFAPIEGELNKSYYTDWITAQQATLCHQWLVAELNRRCPGKISVDVETLKGTVLGEQANVFLKLADCPVTGTHSQINWLGYRLPNGWALAIMNHGAAVNVTASPNLAAIGLTGMHAQTMVTSNGSTWQSTYPANPAQVVVSIPAGGTAIVVWRPYLDYENLGQMKKRGFGTRGTVSGVVTRWLGDNPLFVVESPDRSSGILIFYLPAIGGGKLFEPGDVVSITGMITSSADLPLLMPDSTPTKIGHVTPLTPVGARLADLENRGIAMNGLLVRVCGKVISRDPSGNPSFTINDGTVGSPVTVYTWGLTTLPQVGHFVMLNAIACRLNGAPYLDVWYQEDIVADIALP